MVGELGWVCWVSANCGLVVCLGGFLGCVNEYSFGFRLVMVALLDSLF